MKYLVSFIHRFPPNLFVQYDYLSSGLTDWHIVMYVHIYSLWKYKYVIHLTALTFVSPTKEDEGNKVGVRKAWSTPLFWIQYFASGFVPPASHTQIRVCAYCNVVEVIFQVGTQVLRTCFTERIPSDMLLDLRKGLYFNDYSCKLSV